MCASCVTSAEASWAPPPATIKRPLGRAEALRGGRNGILVDRRLDDGKRRFPDDRAGAAPDIDGAFERRRSGAADEHGSHRFGNEARGFVGLANARRPVDEPRNDPGLVADFVKIPEPAADRVLRNLAEQRQHRGVHAISGEQRSRGIKQARAWHDAIGLRLSGRQSRAERHVGRALLVPCMDRANRAVGIGRVISFGQRVEELVIVYAGQRVNRVEPVGEEGSDRGLPRGHADANVGAAVAFS